MPMHKPPGSASLRCAVIGAALAFGAVNRACREDCAVHAFVSAGCKAALPDQA